MSTPVQTVYAVDPATRKVRAVMQVDPDGWLDAEIEPMLASIVRASNAAEVKLALAISIDSSFVLRSNPSTEQFEIDEIETSELLSPHPLHPDPTRLIDAVLRWCKDVDAADKDFMRMAQLPKRAPEVVALMRGARIETREGAARTKATIDSTRPG
jgi:hypothetical protein